MSLSFKQQLRLRIRAVEFRLPLSLEKMAVRDVPGFSGDPWLPGEREMGVIFTHVPKSAGTSIVDTLFGQKSRHVPVRFYSVEIFAHELVYPHRSIGLPQGGIEQGKNE